jgi:hypothetical protein
VASRFHFEPATYHGGAILVQSNWRLMSWNLQRPKRLQKFQLKFQSLIYYQLYDLPAIGGTQFTASEVDDKDGRPQFWFGCCGQFGCFCGISPGSHTSLQLPRRSLVGAVLSQPRTATEQPLLTFRLCRSLTMARRSALASAKTWRNPATTYQIGPT